MRNKYSSYKKKQRSKNVDDDDENISDEITFNICRQLPCSCFVFFCLFSFFFVFFLFYDAPTLSRLWRLPSFTGEGRPQVTLDFLFQERAGTVGQPTILTCMSPKSVVGFISTGWGASGSKTTTNHSATDVLP